MGKRLVLNFHGIGEPHPWVTEDERAYWCPEDAFLSILDAIPQVSGAVGTAIEITFDDGNVSDIAIAAPALQKRGLTAWFFVCAGRMGRPGYLDVVQLRDLADAGMIIGSHGWDHIDWRTLPRDDALDREINQARNVIAETLARQIDSVAIPFGSYDRRVWKAVTRVFPIVFTSDGGLAPQSGGLVPREAYTIRWEPDTLRRMAARRPPTSTVRRSLSMAYKRHRNTLVRH